MNQEPADPLDLVKLHRGIPSPEELGRWVEGAFKNDILDLDDNLGVALRWQHGAERELNRQHRELPSSIDPHHLAAAGWGAILPPIPQASLLGNRLGPLLALRERQAKGRYRLYKLRPKLNAELFLKEFGETLGTIDPSKVPYYLLLVGSPKDISFEFQYHLSLSHAVGRVWFPNTEGYRKYAESVCAAEESGVDRSRTVTLFSVETDAPTRAIAEKLVPSVQRVVADGFPDWRLQIIRRDKAVKGKLATLLGGGSTPGLLLVSTHGRRAPNEQTRELVQGSLFCQPETEAQLQEAAANRPVVFGARDVKDMPQDLHGLVALFFACNSAGTPVFDSFPQTGPGGDAEIPPNEDQLVISEKPFLARLPSTLLERGALAVLGHIDRAWTTSFVWDYLSGDISTLHSLEDTIIQLLRGHRIGHALRPLHRRYAQIAARLAQMLDRRRIGAHPDPHKVGVYWIALNDARNFMIVGDPAVYLLGQRPPQVTVPLRSRTLQHIEAIAANRRMSVEEWIQEAVDRQLS